MSLPVLTRTPKEIKPYIEKERHKCPFYGFNGMFGMMMDSDGNQCAVITDSYSPCQMEVAGQQPNWSECQFNTSLPGVLKDIRVFPKEFHPPGQASWNGVSLESWVRYITDGVPIEG